MYRLEKNIIQKKKVIIRKSQNRKKKVSIIRYDEINNKSILQLIHNKH